MTQGVKAGILTFFLFPLLAGFMSGLTGAAAFLTVTPASSVGQALAAVLLIRII